MSHLASWLRTRRFSEPTFRPSGATNHWKNTVNRDFPIFSRICIFFLLILSLLTRLTSAFQLSILSEVSLLNFLRLLLLLLLLLLLQLLLLLLLLLQLLLLLLLVLEVLIVCAGSARVAAFKCLKDPGGWETLLALWRRTHFMMNITLNFPGEN